MFKHFPEHLKNHINNQMEWLNTSSITNWNGKNLYVLQEGNMSNNYEGFVFLWVPTNSNKQVSVHMHTCFKSPCNNLSNHSEDEVIFDQW